MSISKRISLFITDKNISQADLANIIGINRQTVNSWIRNNEEPAKISYITTLINHFPELSMDWILLGEGKMYNDDCLDNEKMIKRKDEVDKRIEDKVNELRAKINEWLDSLRS